MQSAAVETQKRVEEALIRELMRLYPSPIFARERAQNLQVALMCPPEPGDGVTCFEDACEIVGLNGTFRPSAIEHTAVLCMRAYLIATWQRPPSRLELLPPLRAWGVPERWLLRLNELDAEQHEEGAA